MLLIYQFYVLSQIYLSKSRVRFSVNREKRFIKFFISGWSSYISTWRREKSWNESGIW